MSDVQAFPSHTGRRRGLLARHAYLLIPCVLIVLYASPLTFYQLPNNFDTLSESFEPLKTLKFVSSRGRAFHKWGPMPNFIYAPLYAPLMAYWYAHGEIGPITTTYPYGFRRPFEQQGDLIALARSTGVIIAVLSVAMYGRALARMTGSRLAVFLALTLCVATSSRLAFDFVATRPDGLMLAFLAGSMAVYSDIISSGLTRRRGVLLSLLAVFSISCKELTAALYIPLYAGLGLSLVARPALKGTERRRFAIDYVLTIAVGVVAYLLINVVYAPATWWLRIAEWLSGPGKDPAVWAPPGYTLSAYAADVFSGALANLGSGGTAIVLVAVAITFLTPPKNRLLLWLPALGFAITIVLMTAGYTPDYFLSPLNVAVVLPVAGALASAERSPRLAASRAARTAALTIVAVLVAINAWTATSVWVRADLAPSALVEKYCVLHVSRGELIHTANLWPRQPGADRLSFLGFDVDDRSLGEALVDSGRTPDVILISREHLAWIEQIKVNPARDEMLVESGYHYRDFPGFEALGYRIADVVEPHVPRLLDVPWVRSLCARPDSSILVFRRTAN